MKAKEMQNLKIQPIHTFTLYYNWSRKEVKVSVSYNSAVRHAAGLN
jgi:hypothetical protein